VLNVIWLKHGASFGSSLHLIEHVRKSRLELKGFLDFVGGHVRVFAVFKEARVVVLTDELDERRGVRFPIVWKPLEVFKDRSDASFPEKRDSIINSTTGSQSAY
jgi:hypothetical protein